MSTEMIDQEYYDLPADWQWIKLGDICTPINGRAFKSIDWKKDGLPIIRIQNLKRQSAQFNYFDGKPDERHLVRNGDLLFAWSGTPGTSFGAHIWKGPTAVLNQHIFKIKFDAQQIDPKYFLHALNQNVTRYVQQAQGGVGLAHITKSKFIDSLIPLAPIEDQKKIVAEIEKQFSRLDEAVTSLKRAKANLKHYKAAVLKAAVEGKLTEEWRKQHPDVEPAAELLKRILAERRRKSEEAELVKMHAKGKTIHSVKWKSKFVEPNRSEADKFSKLPTGWIWTFLETIIARGPQNGLYLHRSAYGSGISILRIDDFQDGTSRSFADLQQVNTTKENVDKYSLEENDLVINRVNSPSHLGKCLVVEKRNLPSLFESNMMRLKVDSQVSVRFVALYLQSKAGKSNLVKNAKWAVNQASINQGDVVSTMLPLPPLQEQEQIVREVERLWSLTTELEKSVERAIKHVHYLRQSVLRKIFSGNPI